MPIDDQQFAATAGVFLKHLNRMFELAVQDMDPQQIDAMLGEDDPLTMEYYLRKPNRRQRRLEARFVRDEPDP